MKYQLAFLFAFQFLMNMFMFHSVPALAGCPPVTNSPRLDLQTPSGCRFQYLFRQQLANPADLMKPAIETPPDAERRLKTLSDWRSEAANKTSSTEAGK